MKHDSPDASFARGRAAGKLGYYSAIATGVSLVGLALLLAGCSSSAAITLPLTSQGNIPLPHETTAISSVDLLTLDDSVGRLYVSHTSNSTLDIVDVKTARVVGSVPGLSGIKAIALTSDPKVVFTSNAGSSSVSAVDVNAMKILAQIAMPSAPDAIDYDPVHDLLLVSLPGAKKLALVSPLLRSVVATIELPGTPELMAVDPNSGQVFLAINDQNEVAVIDDVNQQITSFLQHCDISGPTGVAYDADQNRLFVADHGVLSAIDMLIPRCLGSIDIGHGTDQIAINPRTHHLYTANAGSMNLSVIDTVTLKPLGIVGTAKNAATLAVDPSTGKVYVALPLSGYVAVYHDP